MVNSASEFNENLMKKIRDLNNLVNDILKVERLFLLYNLIYILRTRI